MILPELYYNAYSDLKNENSRLFINNTTLRAQKIFKKEFNAWMLSDFLDMEEINTTLNSLSLTGKIHMLGIIKRFICYKGKINTEIYRKYKNKINEYYDILNIKNSKNEKTKQEQEQFISYKDTRKELIKNIPNIKKMKYTNYRNHLITAYYLLKSPVRLCNLQHMIYIKPDTQLLKNVTNKQKNYITSINGVWYVHYNNFKTSSKMGEISLKIESPELVDLLEHYITKFNIKPNQQLLYNNLSFKPSNICSITIGYAITKTIKKLMNIENVTLNTLRHAKITEFQNEVHTIEEKKQLAKEMNQQYKLNMLDYYVKV